MDFVRGLLFPEKCYACAYNIRPGQKTEKVQGRLVHSTCARYHSRGRG